MYDTIMYPINARLQLLSYRNRAKFIDTKWSNLFLFRFLLKSIFTL